VDVDSAAGYRCHGQSKPGQPEFCPTGLCTLAFAQSAKQALPTCQRRRLLRPNQARLHRPLLRIGFPNATAGTRRKAAFEDSRQSSLECSTQSSLESTLECLLESLLHSFFHRSSQSSLHRLVHRSPQSTAHCFSHRLRQSAVESSRQSSSESSPQSSFQSLFHGFFERSFQGWPPGDPYMRICGPAPGPNWFTISELCHLGNSRHLPGSFLYSRHGSTRPDIKACSVLAFIQR